MDPYAKILVVDDDPTTLMLVKYHLKMMGLKNITTAEDGERALKHIDRECFDLVIADWHMPNMNGIELYIAMRKHENTKNTPFLMITVEKDQNKVREAISEGIREYILKPIQSETLREKVRHLLKKN